MLAQRERRKFEDECLVWMCKYKGLHNIPHWHFEDELIVCISGSATVMLNGHLYKLEEDMCLYCRSESVHNIFSASDCVLLVTQMGRILSRQCWLEQPLFRDRYNVRERLEACYKEFQKKEMFYAERLNSSMILLMTDLFKGENLSFRPYREAVTLNRYKELMAELNSRGGDMSFSEAAAFMNMSEGYFSRSFKETTGMPFSRFMNVLRIDKAISLMTEDPDISITELMGYCGFNTLRHFNRVFKEITGYAPTRLPPEFTLNIRSMATAVEGFDPTLPESQVIL